MTTFKEQLAADTANVFLNINEFAETSTYRPLAGSGRTVAAIWDYGEEMVQLEAEGRKLFKEAEVSLDRAAAPNPARGDTILNAESVAYVVEGVVTADSAFVTVRAVLSARETFGSIGKTGGR